MSIRRHKSSSAVGIKWDAYGEGACMEKAQTSFSNNKPEPGHLVMMEL